MFKNLDELQICIQYALYGTHIWKERAINDLNDAALNKLELWKGLMEFARRNPLYKFDRATILWDVYTEISDEICGVQYITEVLFNAYAVGARRVKVGALNEIYIHPDWKGEIRAALTDMIHHQIVFEDIINYNKVTGKVDERYMQVSFQEWR